MLHILLHYCPIKLFWRFRFSNRPPNSKYSRILVTKSSLITEAVTVPVSAQVLYRNQETPSAYESPREAVQSYPRDGAPRQDGTGGKQKICLFGQVWPEPKR